MLNINKAILVGIVLLSITSCEKMFDYSPYAIDFDEENTNLNQKNIDKILKQQKTEKDTIRIAFTGDTHRAFDTFDNLIDKVNALHYQKPIDFLIHQGDIADFGLPKQYLWGNLYLLKLNIPYLVVVGNHDLVGNGGDAYKEMFGKYDFSFICAEIKFIFINTNGREFNFSEMVPNISWLDSQLKPDNNFKRAIVIFHVPPMNNDFNSDLEHPFHSTIKKYDNVIFPVHGHTHSYSTYTPYQDSVDYISIYSAINNKLNLIEIIRNKFKVEIHEF